jgi:hypothetical protein
MRSTGLAAALLWLWVPASAFAEEYPAVEVYGGYSYLAVNETDFINLHGWNASVCGNVNSWFGIVGDVSGHYGSPSLFGISVPFVDLRAHSFLFGPRFSYRGNERVTPFAHALFGVTRADVLGINDNSLAGAVGGGIDFKVTNFLAVRAFQAEYLVTRFGSEFDSGARQHNIRLSAGVVLRF